MRCAVTLSTAVRLSGSGAWAGAAAAGAWAEAAAKSGATDVRPGESRLGRFAPRAYRYQPESCRARRVRQQHWHPSPPPCSEAVCVCCTLLPGPAPPAPCGARSMPRLHAATWSRPPSCSSASRSTRPTRICSSPAKVASPESIERAHGCGTDSCSTVTPGISALEYAQRRAALARALPPNSVAILAASDTKYRSGAVFYEFHQDPDFFYLTGTVRRNMEGWEILK